MQGLKQTELCRALGQIEEKHSTISMIFCTSKNDEHEIKSKKTNWPTSMMSMTLSRIKLSDICWACNLIELNQLIYVEHEIK